MTLITRLFIICLLPFLFLGCVRAAPDAAEKEHPQLFEKYKIPKELQHSEIGYFLKRMEWLYEAAMSNDWREVLKHPAMAQAKCTWEDLRVYCYFMYDFSTKTTSFYELGIVALCECEDTFCDAEAMIGLVDFKKNKIYGFDDCCWILSFYQTGIPSHFRFLPLGKFPDMDSCLDWDEQGNREDEYAEENKDFWSNVFYQKRHVDLLKLTKPSESKFSLLPPQGYKLQVPDKLNDPKVRQLFDFVTKYPDVIRSGNITELLKIPGFDDKQHVQRFMELYFYDNSIKDFLFRQTSRDPQYGVYLLFDSEGRLLHCILGTMMYVPEADREAGNALKPVARYRLDGDGVEIKFHPSGHPASLRSIVRNRLFGRQTEWNEKGDVLSDVDLDIPTELPEIQKASDEEKKNTSPPR